MNPATPDNQMGQQALQPPDWLSDDARKVFETVARTLEAEDVATDADVAALALCATAYSLAARAAQELEVDGVVIADRAHGGEARKSPAFQIFRESTGIFERMSDRFGMTPRARAALPEVMLNRLNRVGGSILD